MADKEYIERGAVLEEMMCIMAGTGYQAIAMGAIKYAPTADVVPKSNVDYARQHGYESGIRTGAREVFKEIDELIKDYANSHLDAAELVVRLYLLKKKYTEGKT